MNDGAPQNRSLSIAARAKVNLALAVGPPRPADGYHPIASWMARISLADELLITRLPEDRLSRYAILWHADAPRTSPIDWSITKDLAVRAHQLLEKEAGRPLPVQLKLDKRVPVGGGLGGGSADAAAMLLAVRSLFDLDVTDARLAELSQSLGSDVAYFLSDGPALVQGVGDQIERTPAVTGHLVLILPDFGCPTGPVYRAFDESPGSLRAAEVREMATSAALDPQQLFNDLTPPAMRVAPALREVVATATSIANRPVHMSGSGSTLFIIAQGADEAASICDLLSTSLPQCACTPVILG